MLCPSIWNYTMQLVKIKFLLPLLLLVSISFRSNAQFTDSSSGLLSSPSANMYESGTFFITNNYLNEHITPKGGSYGWQYDTFAYGFSISFLRRIEIGYVCTIFNGDWNPIATTERQKIMKNQDRHFYAKGLILRENEFGKKWIPALAVGISDPVTGSGGGEYIGSDITGNVGNGYFNRMFIVATKTFDSAAGEISASIGYQYNFRKDPDINAPCAGLTWKPIWIQNRWFSPKFILEYDSLTPNIGFIADIWDARFQAMFELQNFRWITFGLRFKIRLSGSKEE